MDFFDVMFGKKYGAVPFSKNYFDTLFAAKLAQLEIKTLTGTLPLTFRTSETALRYWTIYGNNTPNNYSAEGTLPLTFTTQTAGAVSDWSISGNDNIGKNIISLADFVDVNKNNVVMAADKAAGLVSVYTTDTPSASAQATVVIFATVTGNYLMSGIPSNAPSTQIQMYCWDSVANARAKAWDRTSASITCDKNNTEVEVYLEAGKQYSINVRVLTSYGTQTTPVIVSPMVRPADTSADFEPYQVGVGQRTANIFTNVGSQNGYLTDTGSIVTPHANLRYTDFLTIPTGATTITFDANFYNSPMNTPAICFYDASKNFISGEIYAQSTPNPRTFTVPNGAFYCRTSYRTAYSKVMLVEGSTAPANFVPYGYEIPISVQGGNLFDKDATDVDKGFVENKYLKSNNTMVGNANWNISEYIDVQSLAKYLLVYGSDNETPGVCYYTSEKEYISGLSYNNQTDIILSIPSNAKYIRFSYMKGAGINPVLKMLTDYTFYIGSTPLTAGQSISKTSTGVDIAAIAGSNTITTELYNKPEMSIEGVDYVGVGEPINDSWQIPLAVTCDRNLFNIYGNMAYSGGVHLINYNVETSSVTGEMSADSYYILGIANAIVKGDETFVISFDKSTAGTAELRMTKGTGSSAEIIETFDISEIKSYRIVFECEESFGNVYPRLVATEAATNTFEHIMIKKASDKGGFVPYGAKYEYNVPIDAPLTEGQSVTDTVTISTFEGENVIDTTLTNKPQMTITYKGG